MILRYLIYIAFIITNVFLSLLLVPFCVLTGRQEFPKWAFYFGNDEYGYHGDKTGFMSDYRGFDISSRSKLYQIWSAYQHNVFRNPCFNVRHCKWVAVDMETIGAKDFTGNTYHHSFKYAFENKYDKKWYRFRFVSNGKWFQSWFYLIPITGKKYIYIRFGMKTYPRNFYDNYWVERNERLGLDTNSRYSIPVFMIRVRSV